MTDIVSKLADQIIALINANPRSPTKAEIEDVVRPMCVEPADSGYVRNCILVTRCAEYPNPLFVEDGGRIVPHLDGYAIIPVEGYQHMTARLRELDPRPCPILTIDGKAWSSAFVTDHINYDAVLNTETLQAAAAKLLANAEETHADRSAWDAQAEKYRRLAEGS